MLESCDFPISLFTAILYPGKLKITTKTRSENINNPGKYFIFSNRKLHFRDFSNVHIYPKTSDFFLRNIRNRDKRVRNYFVRKYYARKFLQLIYVISTFAYVRVPRYVFLGRGSLAGFVSVKCLSFCFSLYFSPYLLL